jgi:hypothetical protein
MMTYNISFMIHLDTDIEHSEQEIKDMIYDQLDSAGVSVENIKVENVKE